MICAKTVHTYTKDQKDKISWNAFLGHSYKDLDLVLYYYNCVLDLYKNAPKMRFMKYCLFDIYALYTDI